MDEFEAVRQLLAERPPPTPDAVAAARASLDRAAAAPAHGLAPLHLNGGRHVLDGDPAPPRRWRRWRGWLAPAAAAAAVAIGVAVSLAVSSTVGFRQAGTKPPPAPAVFRQVPRYFVALPGNALPDEGTRAVVVATATGAVLGQVSPPKPHSLFAWVTAAADDRTFVLGVRRAEPFQHGLSMLGGVGPTMFYRLVLSRSGKPAALAALPTPPVSGYINGFALSPDGSKLAVTSSPLVRVRHGRPPPQVSRLQVFTLATGAERDWVGPRVGWLGGHKPFAKSLSWADDNRTLLVQEHLGQGGSVAELRLLDTAGPGGSLPAASKRVPISSADINRAMFGPLVMTGDGTKIVFTTGTTTKHPGSARDQRLHAQALRALNGLSITLHEDWVHHVSKKIIEQVEQRLKQAQIKNAKYQPTFTSVVEVTEVSVRTGKPVLVLGRRQIPVFDPNESVMWTSAVGTTVIAVGDGPQRNSRIELGIVTGGNTFVPLPKGAQAFVGETPAW
jgi:hypothetical protein